MISFKEINTESRVIGERGGKGRDLQLFSITSQ